MKRNLLHKASFTVLILYVFFMPVLRFGVPVGHYKFTICDLFLIPLFLFAFFNKKLFNKKQGRALSIYVLFFLALASSFVGATSHSKFAVHLLASFNSFMILAGSIITLNHLSAKEIWHIRNAAFISVLLSFLPAYNRVFTGSFNPIFYGEGLNVTKYSYLMMSPNQYIMYVFAYISLIAVMTLKYAPKKMLQVLLLSFFGLVAVLLSASRSGLLLNGFLTIVLFLSYFINAGPVTKSNILLVTAILAFLFLGWIINFINTTAWEFQRSLSVFELLGEGNIIDDFRVNQIKLAKQLFKSSPIFGVGLGNFSEYDSFEMHNTYYSLLAETGLFGFSMYLVFMLNLFLLGNRAKMNLANKIFFFALFIAIIAGNYSAQIMSERWFWVLFSFIIFSLSLTKTHRAKL
jgi:O-antigen ligase